MIDDLDKYVNERIDLAKKPSLLFSSVDSGGVLSTGSHENFLSPMNDIETREMII